MNRIFSFVVIACVLLMTSDLFAQRNDSITLVAGRPVRGEVQQVTPDSLVVQVSGSPVTVDPWNLKQIRFADESPELTRAKRNYVDDRYNACISELDLIAEAPDRKVLQQEIDFYRAAASAKTALAGGPVSANQAGSLISDFIQNNPESFHVIPATNLFGDLAISQGHFDVASEQFDKVANSKWVELALLAKLKMGRALLLGGKFQEATDMFTDVEATDNAEDYALQAKLIARCLRAQALAGAGNADEGEKIVSAIIKNENSDNHPVFAHAYNALGACHAQRGNTKQALQAYLHTDLLFSTQSDAHAEALYQLYKLWGDMNQSDRAGEVRQKIKNRYRNTFWSEKLDSSQG